MQSLFGRGTFMNKVRTAFRLSWQHGRNLGLFVFIYKLIQCLLARLTGASHPFHSFFAGIIGAYFIWSERNAVNQQLCFYLLSRVLEGLANTAVKADYLPANRKYFPMVSMACWGLVMWLFERDSKMLQPSLGSSMQFLYKESDTVSGWRDFVPFYVPQEI